VIKSDKIPCGDQLHQAAVDCHHQKMMYWVNINVHIKKVYFLILEIYVRKKLNKEGHRKLRIWFSGASVLSEATIHCLVNKF
jgi:hypothetical protein